MALELYCDIGRQIGAIVAHKSIIEMNTDLAKKKEPSMMRVVSVFVAVRLPWVLPLATTCTVPKSLFVRPVVTGRGCTFQS